MSGVTDFVTVLHSTAKVIPTQWILFLCGYCLDSEHCASPAPAVCTKAPRITALSGTLRDLPSVMPRWLLLLTTSEMLLLNG